MQFFFPAPVLVERIFYAGRNWLYLKTAPGLQKTAPKVFFSFTENFVIKLNLRAVVFFHYHVQYSEAQTIGKTRILLLLQKR